MGVKKKKILTGFIALMLCLICSIVPAYGAGDDYRIEQLYINMPDVTAYYRSPDGSGDLEAYLGGEKLALMDNASFAETGEAVEYYILMDISSSISPGRSEDIKASLTQFLSKLRESDSMILITFGDTVTEVLNGTESRDEASSVISGIQNNNENTVLFDAINYAADRIWTEGASSEKRRIITVISDGKDCADDTRGVESVQTVLNSRGIPVYTMAVENVEGDSEVDTQNYRSKFAALSRNTGGVPWTITDGGSVMDGLNQMYDAVMNSYRARFTASSNKVSHQNEDFVLKFLSAGNMSDTCSVLVDRSQKDETVPEVVSAKSNEENSITVTFSEKVENGLDAGNYKLTRGDKTIPVNQVIADEEDQLAVRLIFDEDLYKGDYTLQVKNITDTSNEKNAIGSAEIKITTKWKPSAVQLILKWWPIALTVIFVILIIVALIVLKRIKKKRSVLIVGDEVIEADDIQERKHIRMDQLPTRNIRIWISNGRDMPKQMDYILKGSAIIGRATQCDIYCDDPMMSKQHFALEYEGGNIYITDLQSRNGTRVNGRPIQERYRLQSHDEITAGNLKFRIEWN
nr:FHA domain-containing protein [uncultured Blautia sp.]